MSFNEVKAETQRGLGQQVRHTHWPGTHAHKWKCYSATSATTNELEGLLAIEWVWKKVPTHLTSWEVKLDFIGRLCWGTLTLASPSCTLHKSLPNINVYLFGQGLKNSPKHEQPPLQGLLHVWQFRTPIMLTRKFLSDREP